MKRFLILFVLIVILGCAAPKQNFEIADDLDFEIFYPEMSFKLRMPIVQDRFSKVVSIASVGDIMVGHHTTSYIEQYGIDYPFDSTKNSLQSVQFAFGNLEAPFADSGKQFDKRFTFKVPPDYAHGLINAGFDVVNLANNHILDYGIEGLRQTILLLDSLELAFCGAGLDLAQSRMPAIVNRDGYRVAFLGYSMTFPEEFWATDSTGGTAFPTEKVIRKSLQICDSLADFTVVTFHWGAELRFTPKDYQKHFAHFCIDHGADLVIGHHPHVLQGMEMYKNKLIAYSLGNFSFASLSYKATESVILKTYLHRDGLFYAKVIPVNVNNYEISFQPRILKGARADTVLAHLIEYSKGLNGQPIIDKNGYIWGNSFCTFDSLRENKIKEPSPILSN